MILGAFLSPLFCCATGFPGADPTLLLGKGLWTPVHFEPCMRLTLNPGLPAGMAASIHCNGRPPPPQPLTPGGGDGAEVPRPSIPARGGAAVQAGEGAGAAAGVCFPPPPVPLALPLFSVPVPNNSNDQKWPKMILNGLEMKKKC